MNGETAGDFHDWELLADSDSPTFSNYLEIEDVSEEMILIDYFSANGSSRYAKFPANEEVSGSYNPTTVREDTGAYHTQFPRKDPGKLWSDCGSDLWDKQCKVMDFDSNSEFKEQATLGRETSELGGTDDNLHGFNEGKVTNFDVENQSIQRELINLRDSEQIVQDELSAAAMSGGNKSIVEESECSNHQCDEYGYDAAIEEEEKCNGDEVNKRVARSNVPFELLLRYCCLMRTNPIWSSLSLAAAVAGLVILGRKLYRMKHKRRTLPLKITVDDKKVTQFSSRAARLNQNAYSVAVRHIPMISHNLPPTEVTRMSLR